MSRTASRSLRQTICGKSSHTCITISHTSSRTSSQHLVSAPRLSTSSRTAVQPRTSTRHVSKISCHAHAHWHSQNAQIREVARNGILWQWRWSTLVANRFWMMEKQSANKDEITKSTQTRSVAYDVAYDVYSGILACKVPEVSSMPVFCHPRSPGPTSGRGGQPACLWGRLPPRRHGPSAKHQGSPAGWPRDRPR